MSEKDDAGAVQESLVRRQRSRSNRMTDPTHDELAKHYTQHLWSIVNRTNTSLIAWTTAMLLILVGSLIPLAGKVSALNEIKRELRVSSELLIAKVNDMRNLATAKTRNESQVKEAQEAVGKLKKTIDAQRATVERKTKARDTLKNELTNISTPLGPVPIPTFYSPLVWACLFAGLLLFFLYRRSIVLATLAQVIQINTQQRKRSAEEIQRLGWGAPFWLAPLPKTLRMDNGKEISREELTGFLGWKLNERLRPFITLGSMVVGLMLYLWVIKLTFDISQNYNDPHAALRVRISVVMILLFCVAICVFWLRPHLDAGEFGSFMPHSKQRRLFLTASSMTLAAAFLYVLLPRKYLPRRLTARAHRFQIPQKSQATALDPLFRNSFQLHKKSGVLHYVDANGWTAQRFPLSSKNLEQKSSGEVINLHLASIGILAEATNPTSSPTPPVAAPAVSPTPKEASTPKPRPVPPPVAPPSSTAGIVTAASENKTAELKQSDSQSVTPKRARLCRAQLAATTECLALEQVYKKNVDGALKVLWTAIKVDTDLKSGTTRKPDYRLYDLLAGLSHQYAGLFDHAELVKLIQEYWPDDEQLRKRTKQWLAPSQRWLERWQGKDLHWKHPFGTSSSYRDYPILGANNKSI